ncbi:MAG: flagellar motor switch protein FliG [Armatimonadota bacterium]
MPRVTHSTDEQVSGLEKAAILLIALGQQTAASALQQLSPDEVRAVCAQIARITDVDQSLRQHVLDEFRQFQENASPGGGAEYARMLLEQVLGPENAQASDVEKPRESRRFDWIRGDAVPRLAEALSEERPQVIAFVLAHLPPEPAAEVMSRLPDETKGDVAVRLSTIQPVADEITKQIADILQTQLIREGASGTNSLGGPEAVANLINISDRSTETAILDYLDSRSPELAATVRQKMFSFEDIPNLDDRHIQRLIREAEQEDIRLSLKGAPEELKDAFFRNMSERAAQALKEELEMMGPAKLKDVEAARKRVVAVVRRLRDAGEITFGTVDEEELVE